MTRAPAAAASAAESSSEALSTTTTSPSMLLFSSTSRAVRTHSSMFSASLRQGMTTDTSVDWMSSAASLTVGLLFCAVLIALSGPRPLSQGSASMDTNARHTEKWRTNLCEQRAFRLQMLAEPSEGTRLCERAPARGAFLALSQADAGVPDLRLLVPLYGGGRGALVSQPRRATGGGGSRGDLCDAASVGARRAPRSRPARAVITAGPRMALYTSPPTD